MNEKQRKIFDKTMKQIDIFDKTIEQGFREGWIRRSEDGTITVYARPLELHLIENGLPMKLAVQIVGLLPYHKKKARGI